MFKRRMRKELRRCYWKIIKKTIKAWNKRKKRMMLPNNP
jgi:hypothetical protein